MPKGVASGDRHKETGGIVSEWETQEATKGGAARQKGAGHREGGARGRGGAAERAGPPQEVPYGRSLWGQAQLRAG